MIAKLATVLPSCLSYYMFVKVTLTVGQEIVEKHGLYVCESALSCFSDSRPLPMADGLLNAVIHSLLFSKQLALFVNKINLREYASAIY